MRNTGQSQKREFYSTFVQKYQHFIFWFKGTGSNDVKQISPIVLVCLLLVLSSCDNQVANRKPVKIGLNEWTGYDPFIIADQTGLFHKNELNAEIIRYPSANEEMLALRSGEIQGAALTLDEAVKLVSSGFPVKVILVLDYSKGGDMILGQEPITEMTQLAGKTIGFENSIVGEFLLYRALELNGMNSSAIEMVPVSASEWSTAFETKKVDALVCYNPVASKLIVKEKANVLFNSSNIPFQIIDVLVFSNSFYNNNKDKLIKIVQTWFESLEFQEKNKRLAMELIMGFKNIDSIDYHISLEGLLAPGLAMNKAIFDSESEHNIYKYSQPIINFMLAQGLLTQRINTSDLFPNDILLAIDNDTTN